MERPHVSEPSIPNPEPIAAGIPTSGRGASRRRVRWLLAGLAAGALALAGCSSTPTTRKDAPTTTTSTHPAQAAPDCPLTGAPVPGGGSVPQRPALAVKVDNYTTARPQSGLEKADIVFEEPVEGGITRYVAVFQCQEATLVGPIRSARNIDIGILGQLGKPILAHVGGIPPVLANIEASPLVNLDIGAHGTVIQHVPGRVAPYDTYSSTAALWGVFPTDTTIPAPLFSYSPTAPTGPNVTPVASIAIPFSGTSNVVWKFDPKIDAFQRYYGSTPDVLSDGVQNSAANVIVQFVQITYGPWVENSTGGLEVQANLYTNASGPALVFRSGVEIPADWARSSLGQPTQFTTTAGQPIAMQPGQTWVELVPNTVTVTATPPSAPSAPTTTAAGAPSSRRS